MQDSNALMQICELSCLTQDFAEKIPSRECFAPFRKPNPPEPANGPRGEVQWLSGSSRPFEIGFELKFLKIFEIPILSPKLLKETPPL